MTPITPKMTPPIIVAMPILSMEVFAFDNWMRAKPRIRAEKVVLMYDRRVRSFERRVLSSSRRISLDIFFFMDFTVKDCY